MSYLDVIDQTTHIGIINRIVIQWNAKQERVSGDELWLSFFNLTDAIAQQFKQKQDNYYWNQLSIKAIAQILTNANCTQVDGINVSRDLTHQFPGYRHHNHNVQILVVCVDSDS